MAVSSVQYPTTTQPTGFKVGFANRHYHNGEDIGDCTTYFTDDASVSTTHSEGKVNILNVHYPLDFGIFNTIAVLITGIVDTSEPLSISRITIDHYSNGRLQFRPPRLESETQLGDVNNKLDNILGLLNAVASRLSN